MGALKPTTAETREQTISPANLSHRHNVPEMLVSMQKEKEVRCVQPNIQAIENGFNQTQEQHPQVMVK